MCFRYLDGKYILPSDSHAGAASFANSSLTQSNATFEERMLDSLNDKGVRGKIPGIVMKTRGLVLAGQEVLVNYKSQEATSTMTLLQGKFAELRNSFPHLQRED